MGNRSVDPAATPVPLHDGPPQQVGPEQPSPHQMSPAAQQGAVPASGTVTGPGPGPDPDEEVTPALPWRVPLDPAPWWAWALFVTPFIAVPALNSWLWMGARDMLAVGLLIVIGASVVRIAGGVVLYRVVLTSTGLKARTSMLIRSLAWQDVDRIEVGDDNVVLTRGQDENEINGIPKDQTAYVAAVMEALHREAANHPTRRHRPRPGIGTLFVLTYLVLSVGAFLIRWQIV